MEIAGKEYDVTDLLKQASDHTIEQFRRNNMYGPINFDKDCLRQELEDTVWSRILWNIDKDSDKGLVAEAAVAELIRRGLKKEEIKYRDGLFFFKLKNRCYHIRKNGSGMVAGPVIEATSRRRRTYMVGDLKKTTFADFILAFDDLVPQIDEAFSIVLAAIDRELMEERKSSIATEMKRKMILTLVEEYLNPLNLSCHFSIRDDNMVHLEIEERKTAVMEIPFEKVPEFLKDTESIRKELKADLLDPIDDALSFTIR